MTSDEEQHLYGVVVNEHSVNVDSKDRLMLMQGEIVKIFKQDGEWAYGSLYGKTGWFPVRCVDFLWGWQPSSAGNEINFGRKPPILPDRTQGFVKGPRALPDSKMSSPTRPKSRGNATSALVTVSTGQSDPSLSAESASRDHDEYEELSVCSGKSGDNFAQDYQKDLIELGDLRLKDTAVHKAERNSPLEYTEEFKQCCDKLALLCRTETAMIAIDDQNEPAITSIQKRIQECRTRLDELGASIKKHIPDGGEIMEQFQHEHRKFLEEQEDVRSKIRQIRSVDEEEKLVREIIESEKKYNHSLHLVIEEVAAPIKDVLSKEEYDGMFSRLEDVALFSSTLLDSMEQSPKDICKVFLDHWEELCEVYSEYVFNYDALVIAYGKLELEKRHLIEENYKSARSTAMYPNAEGFFLSPIQRIMQYPLFLGRWCKIMPAGDPRLEAAEKIYALMKEFVLSVDQVQTRNHTVYRYLTKEERTWLERLHRVNWRSIDKKANRTLQRIAERFIPTTAIDRRFEEGAKQFKNAKRRLKLFILSISKTVGAMQLTGKRCWETTFCVVNRSDRLQEETADCMEHLRKVMEHLTFGVKRRVTEPCQALLYITSRSTKLISKRMDKLLDYEHYRTRNEVLAKQILSDYVDLNEQLCRDLPILCERIDYVVDRCFYNFLHIQCQYNQSIQLYYKNIERAIIGLETTNDRDVTQTLEEISRMAICGAFPHYLLQG